MISVDLNCDMGESFGAYTMGDDAAIMPYVSSVNIACGFHAGDATVMRKTIQHAMKHGLAIGAHPGFPDLQGFGRRELKMSADEIYDLVLYQIAALDGIARACGGSLYHVKPHGALYNMGAKDEMIATAMVHAVRDFNPALRFTGLSGSLLVSVAEKNGLTAVHEVFADRTYQDDGSLTPRSFSNSLIKDEQESILQVMRMVQDGKVVAVSGKEIDVRADSVCIHGDGKNALSFARQIATTLQHHGIAVKRK